MGETDTPIVVKQGDKCFAWLERPHVCTCTYRESSKCSGTPWGRGVWRRQRFMGNCEALHLHRLARNVETLTDAINEGYTHDGGLRSKRLLSDGERSAGI